MYVCTQGASVDFGHAEVHQKAAPRHPPPPSFQLTLLGNQVCMSLLPVPYELTDSALYVII